MWGRDHMGVTVTQATVKNILTRATGYLRSVASHSLQPYRGCTFGESLCGVGCYVQHNRFLTRDAVWGSFLEARVNAAEAYARQYGTERDWARRTRGRFSIFMSSSTDPFVPQEDRFQITRQILEAMVVDPPDVLIIQTHTHRVALYVDLYRQLTRISDLRVHITVESDRDRLPGLPPPASSVDRRLDTAAALKRAGLHVVITIAPLLPVENPRGFFRRVAAAADAVVVDHFIEGDGTPNGARTLHTPLPVAMETVDPTSTALDYRDRIVAIAMEIMPGRVGVGMDGFAGRFLSAPV